MCIVTLIVGGSVAVPSSAPAKRTGWAFHEAWMVVAPRFIPPYMARKAWFLLVLALVPIRGSRAGVTITVFWGGGKCPLSFLPYISAWDSKR